MPSAWTYVPPVPVAEVRVPEDWRFVIASSGVAARKTGAARDAYNNLALTVRRAPADLEHARVSGAIAARRAGVRSRRR